MDTGITQTVTTSLQSIISQQTINNITDLLTSLAPQDVNGTSIEVETRFGQFTGNEFRSGVSRRTFNRIRDTASKLNPRHNYIHSRDEVFRDLSISSRDISKPSNRSHYQEDTERFTTVLNNEGIPQQTYRLVKSRIRNFDIPEYSLRISVSREITDDTPKPQVTPIYIREKKRWSYNLSQSRFRLDLTEVTTYRPSDKDPRRANTVYEVEIEVLSPKVQNLALFEQIITVILKEIQGTILIYTSQEKADIITKTNGYIGASVNRFTSIDLDALIQPRNLKIRDLAMGEIVPITMRDVRYSVTIKADGVRKLLVIDRLGIYLIYADEVMKIASATISQRLQTWHGTVFECEIIPKSNIVNSADNRYKNATIYALLYDTLSAQGRPSVRNLDHPRRLEYAQEFMNVALTLKTYIFEVKRFNQFSTVADFYRMNNDVLLGTYPFLTDGLIYTPDNYRYDTVVNRMPLPERRLSRQPDIMKWKPPTQLTIDLAVSYLPSPDGVFLELLASDGTKLVPFTGTPDTPFNFRTDILIGTELQNAANGSVFEFRWTNEDIDAAENTQGKFVVVRSRYDKPYPNKLDVAKDVWRDIHSPIDEDTIRGGKFSLVFRYHNRIKWNLYNSVKDALPKVDGINIRSRTLLDIGSGKGGDVAKWIDTGFTHIICVEPNEANRIELKRRLDQANEAQYKLNKSVIQYRIIATIGQDFETIISQVVEFAPGGKVDVISYMLSLSFFFDQSSSTISIPTIVNYTLAQNGYFIAFTIDGRYVLEYFNQPANFTEINGSRRSNMQLIDFELKAPSTVVPIMHIFINIPNSIVTNQTEYLTNISELQQLLFQTGNTIIGLKRISEMRADQEGFLLTEEIQYTRLFTSFIMKR